MPDYIRPDANLVPYSQWVSGSSFHVACPVSSRSFVCSSSWPSVPTLLPLTHTHTHTNTHRRSLVIHFWTFGGSRMLATAGIVSRMDGDNDDSDDDHRRRRRHHENGALPPAASHACLLCLPTHFEVCFLIIVGSVSIPIGLRLPRDTEGKHREISGLALRALHKTY